MSTIIYRMKNILSTQKINTEKKTVIYTNIVIDNTIHVLYEQCNNYEVQRWLINRFTSVVSRIKSTDHVKHSSLLMLPT